MQVRFLSLAPNWSEQPTVCQSVVPESQIATANFVKQINSEEAHSFGGPVR